MARSSCSRGGCAAMSASVSSLTMRPRGRSLPLRLALAPRGQRLQAAEHSGLRLGADAAARRSSGSLTIVGRIGDPLHLLIEPFAAPGLAQLLEHPREELGEMGDVADRIVDLALVERPARPVGEARALVEGDAEPGCRRGSNSRPARLARAPSPRSACRTAGAASCRSGCGRSRCPARRRGRPSARPRCRSSGRAAASGRSLRPSGRSPPPRSSSAIWIRQRSGQ